MWINSKQVPVQVGQVFEIPDGERLTVSKPSRHHDDQWCLGQDSSVNIEHAVERDGWKLVGGPGYEHRGPLPHGTSRVFRSKYNGTCSLTGTPFIAGDLVRYEDTTKLVLREHASGQDDAKRKSWADYVARCEGQKLKFAAVDEASCTLEEVAASFGRLATTLSPTPSMDEIVAACDARRGLYVATTTTPGDELPGRRPWGPRNH